MKILIVDDHEDNIYMLKSLFEGHGHEVFTATNGIKGIEILGDYRPDLIISDIFMPEMDGLQFCKKIKTDGNTRNIPFVFYTATYTGPQDESLVGRIGADGFIIKPCDPEDLMSRINEIMIEAGKRSPGNIVEKEDEQEILKLFNERLVRKLEQKIMESEHEIQIRKEAEEAFLVSHERLTQAQRLARMGDFIFSLERREINFSDSLLEILKYESDFKCTPEDLHEIIHHPDDKERISKWLNESIDSGKDILPPNEYRVVCKDGEIKHVKTTGIIRYIDGKPDRVFGTVLDVTDYKILEKQLKKNVNDLKAAQKKLQNQAHWLSALNSLSGEIARNNSLDSIFHIALGHLRESFNFTLAGITQCSAGKKQYSISALVSTEENIDRNIGLETGSSCLLDKLFNCMSENQIHTYYLKDINPDSYKEEDLRELIKKLGENNIKTITTVMIYRECRKKGFLFMMFRHQIEHTDMENHFFKGMVEYLSVAIQNRNLYDDLQESYYTLKQTQKAMMDHERMKAIGQMASGIAHDINNTLAPITLYIEALINSDAAKIEPVGRYLQSIQNASRDIEETVHRLRMFYKHEERDEFKKIDIIKLINNVVEMTRPKWKDIPNKTGKGIKLETILSGKLKTIYGNPTEIREALINLIFNAVDAMPEGGSININVFMDIIESCEYLAVEVSDTGKGMTAEQKNRCLEPFFTSKGVNGSGLGLAMVAGTIQRHDGEIIITSDMGKGTTVKLLFPTVSRKSTNINQNEVIKPVELPPLRILFVDDNAKIRDVVREMLAKHGHQVDVFSEGRNAVNAFIKAKENAADFHVVITDLGMPHMDGEEVAGLIKTISPEVPVILLSGWGDFINEGKHKPPNIDKLLSKPPTVNRLLSAISELLNNDEDKTQATE